MLHLPKKLRPAASGFARSLTFARYPNQSREHLRIGVYNFTKRILDDHFDYIEVGFAK